MNAVDRNLLLRVARRLEEQAETEFAAAQKLGEPAAVVAKRRRDRELIDAKDLREYVKRTEEGPKHEPETTAAHR